MEYIEHNEELVMDISFECDKCAHWVETMVYVPYPDLMAEKNKDSQVEVEAEVYCDACGHEHQVIVSNTFFRQLVILLMEVISISIVEPHTIQKMKYKN